jgi:triacylglycerol lipase
MNTILTILLVIIFFILSYVIANIIIVYFNGKKALNYAWFNTNKCGKKRCPNISQIAQIPQQIQIEEWSLDIAKYSAFLVDILETSSQDKIKPVYPTQQKVLKQLYNNTNDPIFGSILENSNVIWIIFRGTLSKNELYQDLQLEQEQYLVDKDVEQIEFKTINGDKGLVHKGFVDSYNNFKEDLITTLKKNNPNKNKTVIISGHSLGAAVSTIVGLDLTQKGYSTVVYNFASPRVGNKSFQELIDNYLNIFRVVNISDIIPNLPASVTPNYKDPENPHIYVHCGIIKTFDDNWLSKLNNHLIPVYMNALEKIKIN